MQAAFMDNSTRTTCEVRQGDARFPRLEHRGDTPAQVFLSSPAGGSESMRLMYLRRSRTRVARAG